MSKDQLPPHETVLKFRDLIEIWHRGKGSAILSSVIENRLSVPGQAVRAMTNYWNGREIWIASCHLGYFLAVTDAEKHEYLAQLNSRVAGINNRIHGLTKHKPLNRLLNEMERIEI